MSVPSIALRCAIVSFAVTLVPDALLITPQAALPTAHAGRTHWPFVRCRSDLANFLFTQFEIGQIVHASGSTNICDEMFRPGR
jgi:hypothetical protein